MNFRSKKWTIPLLLVLISFAIGIFLIASLGSDFFKGNLKSRFLGTFSQNPFKKQSQVKASLVDSKLNLNFDLILEDKAKFASFIENWFGTNEEITSLSFGVDENIKKILNQNLPVDLKLTITDKSLVFNSSLVAGLQNPLIKSDIEFATGSSKLDIQYTDSAKYQLKIEDPADLANYATASGKLTASTKLEGLFKTLPKVATIELNVSGKNISGSIKLK